MHRFAPLLLLLACTGAPGDDTGTPGDDTSADTDTAPACSTLNSGDDWAWNGECPQMRTPCDIVVTACSFTIDYDADGGMTMGMPYAGTIDADTTTFEDGDSVPGCVGSVEDADPGSRACAHGWTFTRRR